MNLEKDVKVGSEDKERAKFEAQDIITNAKTTEICLYDFVFDASWSMKDYNYIMRKAIGRFKNRLSNIDEKNSIFVRKNLFGHYVKFGQFKNIQQMNTEYTANIDWTNLYHATEEVGNNFIDIITEIQDNGYDVKPMFLVFSDGEDTSNVNQRNNIKRGIFSCAQKTVDKLNDMQIITAFVKFGKFDDRAAELGFKNIEQADKSPESLLDLMELVGSSCIKTSRSSIIDTDNFFANI